MTSIGIDVGGTNIKAVLCDVGGAIHHRAVLSTNAAGGPDAAIARIHDAIVECLAHVPAGLSVAGIGIGLPGSIDQARGIVSHPPNLPGWTVVPIGSMLHDRWDLPVRVDNDANCAALGEAWFGAGRDHDSFIGLTLGTGVGSGIIMDRRLYLGTMGYAGEFGHMSIDHAGPACNCGSRGCIEAYVGNAHLTAEAAAIIAGDATCALHHAVLRDPTALTPRHIAEAAHAGDSVCLGILRRAGERLGWCIASAANLLDITTFIVGGGVSAAGAPLFDGMRAAATERALRVHRQRLVIIPAALGNDAGMLGAAALNADIPA